MSSVKFKVRNKLHLVENVGHAQIQFLDDDDVVRLSGTTDAHGVVSLNLHSLPNGTYTCNVTAADTDDNPVGPDTATDLTVPDRIYRPVSLTVRVAGHAIQSAAADNPQYAKVAVSGNLVVVNIQPAWMKSPASGQRHGHNINMIIVHHTAGNTLGAVLRFLTEVSPHYMIDTDGQIVKWTQDSRAAWHAGYSRWAGVIGINPVSVGIEIVHDTGPYPETQYTALLNLIDRITTAFPSIDRWNIVGHSDIGTDEHGVLERKSGDPGSEFQWVRLESRGLGLLSSPGTLDMSMYGGFFQTFPTGSIHRGDNEKHQRFNGGTHNDFTGHPVRELQQDLATIGYSVGEANGDFGDKTHSAVMVFQEHFFAGGRGPAPNGRVDLQTAILIKSVLACEAVRSSHLGDFPVTTANMA